MAGPIPTLTVTANAILTWSAQAVSTLNGTIPSANQLGQAIQFQTQLGAFYPADQVKLLQISIPAGGSVNIDLSLASANIMGNTLATFARLFAVEAWLPSAAQSSSLGCSASKVVLGRAATNPAMILGMTSGSAVTVVNGELNQWISPTTSGYPITATAKNLNVANSDSVNAATLILALVGNDV